MTSRRKVVFSIQILNITFVAHLKKSYFLLSNIHGGATRKKVVFAWIKWPGVAREQECSYGGGGNTRGSGGSGWFPDDRQALFRTLRANHDFFPNSALAFLNTGCFQKFLGTVSHSETLLFPFPFFNSFSRLVHSFCCNMYTKHCCLYWRQNMISWSFKFYDFLQLFCKKQRRRLLKREEWANWSMFR